MSSFKITMTDETGKAVQTLEACIRGAGDWSGFWADKSGPISQAWADSRRAMFLSQGRSTGTPWPDYTDLEQRYYLPVKRWAIKKKKVTKASLLRWDGTTAEAGAKERLFPSMAVVSHPQYIYRVDGNVATMGTSVPYARNHNLGVGAWTRKVSAASVQRAIDRGNRALKRSSKAKTLEDLSNANRKAEALVDAAKQKLADHKRGAISVPTPKRPLLAFGRPFMLAVRRELEQVALKSGGKIGITSAELRERAKVARAVRGLP